MDHEERTWPLINCNLPVRTDQYSGHSSIRLSNQMPDRLKWKWIKSGNWSDPPNNKVINRINQWDQFETREDHQFRTKSVLNQEDGQINVKLKNWRWFSAGINFYLIGFETKSPTTHFQFVKLKALREQPVLRLWTMQYINLNSPTFIHCNPLRNQYKYWDFKNVGG